MQVGFNRITCREHQDRTTASIRLTDCRYLDFEKALVHPIPEERSKDLPPDANKHLQRFARETYSDFDIVGRIFAEHAVFVETAMRLL